MRKTQAESARTAKASAPASAPPTQTILFTPGGGKGARHKITLRSGLRLD